MSVFTSEILEYTAPHPFVLPSEMEFSTGFGSTRVTTKKMVWAIPFDGRYLEEIMFNINKARDQIFGKSQLQFNSYNYDGSVKETFTPVPNFSYLNNAVSIVAFAQIVEDIKAAIEDTVEDPDHMKAHFGRCFNLAHYRGLAFTSRGLLDLYPDMRPSYWSRDIPFYTFPEDLSGEAMYGIFHKFQYYLPTASSPTRRVLVDAFQKAKARLTDGIPMFTRMQNGEWPITKDELLTVLGMSIYSLHGDSKKRPAENADFTSHINQYSIVDHKRVFNTFCSFVIQMLRYQVPKMEQFQKRQNTTGRWWSSKWFLYKENCANFWARQDVSKMLEFDSGRWHFCGHGKFEGDGAYLDTPPPGRSTGLTWFTDCNIIDQQFAPYLPYGFAPGLWHTRSECQANDRMDYWTFHKFQTFELRTVDEIAPWNIEGGNGFAVRLSMDLHEMIPARTGGPTLDWLPWYEEEKANVVVLKGAPQTKIPIYEKFLQANTDTSLLETYHNVITGISIALVNESNYPASVCNYSGAEEGGLSALITHLCFIDDGIHAPEEFLE
jgi:hypothetical protein